MTSGTYSQTAASVQWVPMRVDGRFNIAGFAGWLACMVPSGVDLYEGRLSGWPAGVWSAAFLTFGATYARYLWRPAAQRRSTIDILLVSAQTGAGLAMVWAAYGMTKYLCGITLVIVAGELPYVCSRRVAWIWVAAQCGVLTAIFGSSFSWLAAVSGGGAFAASHVFNVGQSFPQAERAGGARAARQGERRVEDRAGTPGGEQPGWRAAPYFARPPRCSRASSDGVEPPARCRLTSCERPRGRACPRSPCDHEAVAERYSGRCRPASPDGPNRSLGGPASAGGNQQGTARASQDARTVLSRRPRPREHLAPLRAGDPDERDAPRRGAAPVD